MAIATQALDVNQYIAERARVKIAQIRPKTSQGEIGDALGINQQHVSKRLNGHTRFSVSDVIRLAALFDCDVSELLPPHELLVADPAALSVTHQYHAGFTSPPKQCRAPALSLIRRRRPLVAEPLKIHGGTRDEYKHANDLGYIRESSIRCGRVRRYHQAQDGRHPPNHRIGHRPDGLFSVRTHQLPGTIPKPRAAG